MGCLSKFNWFLFITKNFELLWFNSLAYLLLLINIINIIKVKIILTPSRIVRFLYNKITNIYMKHQNLVSFWPYWNCEENVSQVKTLSRPVPIRKKVESQDLVNFFAARPPIFNSSSVNGEWEFRIDSRYYEVMI